MKDPIFEHNKGLEKYFKTSDGQGFFTFNAAANWAKSLGDKKVTEVIRDLTPSSEGEQSEAAYEKEALIARYEELTGKTAPKNISEKTLIKRIEEMEETENDTADETAD